MGRVTECVCVGGGGEGERVGGRDVETRVDMEEETGTETSSENGGWNKEGRGLVWLVGFLTSSSTTRRYRGRAPRQSV